MTNKGILDEGGGKSSMRFSLILVAIGVFLIMGSIALFIVMAALGNLTPDWTTMGVFTVSVGTLITGVSYTKVLQKEKELKNGKNKEE
jgi:membrane protein implicated in regulation of membrane protease activity